MLERERAREREREKRERKRVKKTDLYREKCKQMACKTDGKEKV